VSTRPPSLGRLTTTQIAAFRAGATKLVLPSSRRDKPANPKLITVALLDHSPGLNHSKDVIEGTSDLYEYLDENESR
jgi:hypothetical protein